jgi:hypothetical protein
MSITFLIINIFSSFKKGNDRQNSSYMISLKDDQTFERLFVKMTKQCNQVYVDQAHIVSVHRC